MCEGPASPGRSARREESSRRSRPTVEMSHALPSKHSLLSGSSQNGPRRPEAGGGRNTSRSASHRAAGFWPGGTALLHVDPWSSAKYPSDMARLLSSSQCYTYRAF